MFSLLRRHAWYGKVPLFRCSTRTTTTNPHGRVVVVVVVAGARVRARVPVAVRRAGARGEGILRQGAPLRGARRRRARAGREEY